MKIAMQRRGGALVPATRAAQAEFDRLPQGAMLKAEVTQDRSGPHHRYYWALCTLVADALNAGPGDMAWTQEIVSDRLKIATGRCHVIDFPPALQRKFGTPVAVKPASISFAKMDQAEFGRFVDAAIAYLIVEFGDWIVEAPQWREVQDILTACRAPEPPSKT